jgi:hypothetical protein
MQDDNSTEPKETPENTEVNTEQSTAYEQMPPAAPKPKSHKRLWLLIILAIIVLAAGGFAAWHWHHKPAATVSTSTKKSTASTPATTTKVQGVQLDTSKNYGNKYADGILPVGDGKYVTDAPKQGYVYACSQYAQNLATNNGGAMTRGPWFSGDGKTYDINKKVHVSGSVHWTGSFRNTISGDIRTIVSNDLPLTDPTGIFPIQSSDPAYLYDRNPNTITAQSFTYDLSANPTYNATPNCIGGTVGVMLTGVELNSAFDAGGRDAGAWETQDDCSGHPQEQGVYHYHTLSSCIKDTSVHTVIGFALDGFPITGPTVGKNNILTTNDLDECHGLTSQITLDGKSVAMYHYVMTEDFPYSISCYRGTAIQPPGLQNQQQAQQSGQIPNRQSHP